ncbi:MAG: hypothetical protein WEB60_08790 [Terrimicrobiaceae bacterium]
MKILLAFGVVAVLSSCTTLENRRDLYSPQKVNGPYTRALKDGIPQPEPVAGKVTVETTGSSKSVVR